jgi:hypothetical protein
LYALRNVSNFDLQLTVFFIAKLNFGISGIIRRMAELNAELFRGYFGGSWVGKITRNGEFLREVVFNWPEAFGAFSALGTESGLIVPPQNGVQDDTRQITMSGWRGDVGIWCTLWHNEFGGYGELKWTSQDILNGITTLYGSLHECKQETDDPTDHIALCEIYDQNSFKYTIKSHRKGILEIVARRIRTGKELNELLKKQADTAISFAELNNL